MSRRKNREGRIFFCYSHAIFCNSIAQKAGATEGLRIATEEKTTRKIAANRPKLAQRKEKKLPTV